MNFYILTIFPEMIESGMNHSIIKRAMEQNSICIIPVDIRTFSLDKHKKVDDYPFGGGVGMVMTPEPIYNAYKSIEPLVEQGTKVLYMSPQGQVFHQKMAEQLATEQDIILLCGHYEGIDERIIETIVTDEVSIGDYVLTGGELAAMVVMDAVARLIPGVLGKEASFQDESFSDSFLEYPQYTRPRSFLGKEVPEILLSGHHQNITKWRKEQSVLRTQKKRPDLIYHRS